jgi:hypothetical protein
MAEFIVLILKQTADAAGRATGLSIAAVKVSSDAAHSQTLPLSAAAVPFFTTEFALHDTAMIVLPDAPVPAANTPFPTIANPLTIAPPAQAPGAGSLPPHAWPMPGWLAAHTSRQALLAGRTSRPLNRATSRRPRPGNRPARRIQAPRCTPKRTVVWMEAR